MTNEYINNDSFDSTNFEKRILDLPKNHYKHELGRSKQEDQFEIKLSKDQINLSRKPTLHILSTTGYTVTDVQSVLSTIYILLTTLEHPIVLKQLLDGFKKFLLKISKRFIKWLPDEKQDILQEAMIAFVNVILEHQTGIGYNLFYIQSRIKQEVKEYCAQYKQTKTSFIANSEQYIENKEAEMIDPHFMIAYDNFYNTLNQNDKFFLRMRSLGDTRDLIMKNLGLNRHQFELKAIELKKEFLKHYEM